MGSILILNPYFLYSQSKFEEINYNSGSGNFAVYAYGMYISSAELQDNIKSNIPFLRDASIELNGGFGYGGEFTFNPRIRDLDIVFFISAEYLKAKDDQLALFFQQDTNSANVRFREEYQLFPIEAGLKWNLPVGTEKFKIYIGGGAGLYFGSRTRTLGNLKSFESSVTPGFSMNVLAGTEYFVARNLSLDFEFKFREASFDSESRFSTECITVNGINFVLDNPFYSRIIVDGPRLSLGFRYHF
ncbi:MAG: outer membrane beta-barrel protein [Ignavibacteria bacterium]|nr:outer membrane beta-barrel protein [Ignavibacteria bacterium]